MNFEIVTKEYYFDKDTGWREQLAQLESEGWSIVEQEPIDYSQNYWDKARIETLRRNQHENVP